MAVLVDADRVDIWADLQRILSQMDIKELLPGMLKTDIRAAVNAADDWANTNASAYNLALPLAFRTNATSSQKARLLMLVIAKRFVKGV